MSVFDKLVAARRRGGTREVLRAVRRRATRRSGENMPVLVQPSAPDRLDQVCDEVPLRGHYQDKLAPALSERSQLFDRAVDDRAFSLIDIGCNLGDFTAHYARRGLWCVGVDSSRELIEEARHRYRDVANCAFMISHIDPESVRQLPEFDIVLLLSVHHHWLSAHGPSVAGEMLRDIVSRAKMTVVFESSSRNVRFGTYRPGVTDNDPASVIAYHEQYLGEYVADLATVERLGKSRCVGPREPYRWSWADTA